MHKGHAEDGLCCGGGGGGGMAAAQPSPTHLPVAAAGESLDGGGLRRLRHNGLHPLAACPPGLGAAGGSGSDGSAGAKGRLFSGRKRPACRPPRNSERLFGLRLFGLEAALHDACCPPLDSRRKRNGNPCNDAEVGAGVHSGSLPARHAAIAAQCATCMPLACMNYRGDSGYNEMAHEGTCN